MSEKEPQIENNNENEDIQILLLELKTVNWSDRNRYQWNNQIINRPRYSF